MIIKFFSKLFSWKATSNKGQIEFCLPGRRLLSGLYGLWNSMTMPLHNKMKAVYFLDFPFIFHCFYSFHNVLIMLTTCSLFKSWFLKDILKLDNIFDDGYSNIYIFASSSSSLDDIGRLNIFLTILYQS